ncbi:MULTISPECIES: tetratricopeptide repeat protein [Rhizobium]|uniref:Tetratricopeptide repeat protein n=1 Tax=Rhizobium tropici TaxID=398 RepID=A0A6P1CDG8_RHITR|nr:MULTISPECIES: tetratricopeptide repeat protein [Rhizobium]MBB5592127.1 tetratricopeptide (TPR) repeat protein [Rhizobium tropici]NEV14192.1 tetratricopeptide repeat protein [Rhizobium tropici]
MELQVRAVVAAFNSGKHADALRLCRDALNDNPDDAVLNHLLAAGSFAVRDFVTALDCAEESLKARPGNTATLFLAGRAARALGRLDLAESYFAQLPVAFPEALAELARTLEQNSKRQQAAKAWQRAFEINPSSREAAARLGRLLWEAGDFENARERLEFAVKADAPHSAWFDLGLVRQDCGDLAGAVDAFKTALARKPDDPQAKFNLGSTLQQLGDMEGAIDAYRDAYALSPATLGMIANVLCSGRNGLLFLNRAELRSFLSS